MTINKFKTLKGSFDTYDIFTRKNPLNYYVCCNCGERIRIYSDSEINNSIESGKELKMLIPYFHDDETYCEECFFQHHKICMECGEHHDEDNMVYHEMGDEGEEIVYFTCPECDKKHKAFLNTIRQNFSHEIYYQVKVELYNTEEIEEAIKKLEELTSTINNQLKAL